MTCCNGSRNGLGIDNLVGQFSNEGYDDGEYFYPSSHLSLGGLGIDPVTVTAVIAASQQGIALLKNRTDATRFQRNLEAYKAAVAGYQNALEFLKYMSGRFGTGNIGPFPGWSGGIGGGWATQAAKDDAWRLYNSALAAWGLTPEDTGGLPGDVPPPSGTPVPTPTPTPTYPPYSYPPGPPQGLPPVVTTASMSYMPLVLAGAVALFFTTRQPRSRSR